MATLKDLPTTVAPDKTIHMVMAPTTLKLRRRLATR